MKIALVHVPKTGGTTCTKIITRSFRSENKQLITNPTDCNQQLHDAVTAAATAQQPYFLAGHFPAHFFDLSNFDFRITILRPPLETIASTLSFSEKNNTGHEIFEFLKTRKSYSIYNDYFNPTADIQRWEFERTLGVGAPLGAYCERIPAAQAVAGLSNFDSVLDFLKIELEIKRLIIELELYPPKEIEDARAYKYAPPRDEASALLGRFDREFYELGSRFFRRLDPSIEQKYESYRYRYSSNRGWSLSPSQTVALPLEVLSGTGWYSAEPSSADNATFVMWSEGTKASISLPLQKCGLYRLHLYFFDYRCDYTGGYVSSELSAVRTGFTVTRVREVAIFSADIAVLTGDWLDLSFYAEKKEKAEFLERNGQPDEHVPDLRDPVMFLAKILLRRIE